MEIKQYVQLLRAHGALIAATVALCAVAAGVYAWTREPLYASHTQLFVSTKSEPAGQTPSEVYQGGLASQSRAESYARIVSSPPVVEAVIGALDEPRGTQELQAAITATVPEGTVLIDIKVTDESAELAKQIADAVAVELPRFVNRLESSPATEESPVQISVTSPAQLPAGPESPRKGLILFGGVVLGMALGVGAAVVRELLDARVRDDAAAATIAGAPVLGRVLHDWSAARRPLVVLERPDSPEAEAYRVLRTNLHAVTIDGDRRSLLVTSAVAGEGKTLVAANLGIAFAQAGHRVVLVDANLRRPALGSLLRLPQAPGLSELLAGEAEADPLHTEGRLPLEVLTGGAPSSNPTELLESDRFSALLERLARRAEIVIVDAPALLSASDAAIAARAAAAALLVTRVPSTRVDELGAAAEALGAVGRRPVGVVLSGLPARAARAYVHMPRAATRAPRTALSWGRDAPS